MAHTFRDIIMPIIVTRCINRLTEVFVSVARKLIYCVILRKILIIKSTNHCSYSRTSIWKCNRSSRIGISNVPNIIWSLEIFSECRFSKPYTHSKGWINSSRNRFFYPNIPISKIPYSVSTEEIFLTLYLTVSSYTKYSSSTFINIFIFKSFSRFKVFQIFIHISIW